MSKIVTSNLEASASFLNLLSTFKGGPLGVSPFEGSASLSIATSNVSFTYLISAPSGFISWKGTGTNLQFDDLNRPIAGTITSFSQSSSFDTAGGPAQTNSFELTDAAIDASTIKSGSFGDIVFAENNDVTLEFFPFGPFTQNSSVHTGSGDDTVRLVSEIENFMIGNVGATIDLGSGNDTAEISSAYPNRAFTRITTGSGKDNILIDFDEDNASPVSIDLPDTARLITVTDYNPDLDRISLADFPEGFGNWKWILLETDGSVEAWAVKDEDGSGTFNLLGTRVRLEGVKQSEVKLNGDAILGVNVPNQVNLINGTDGDDFLLGTDGDDIINMGGGIDVANSSAGNDVINGGTGAYNQVDYDGKPSDYSFTKNDDGSVTVEKPNGTDTLRDILGIWFKDDQWYPIEDLIENDGNGSGQNIYYVSNGTDGDDIINLIERPTENSVVLAAGSDGNDTINGVLGELNQVDYAGYSSDYRFTQNSDGSIKVTKPNGIDTLTNIESIWFLDEQKWSTLDDLIEPNGPNIIETSPGNYTLRGTDQDDVFILHEAKGTVYGSEGFDIVRIPGAPEDYDFYPGKGMFTLVGQNGNRINNIIDGGQANEKFVFDGTGQAFTQFEIGDYYSGNNPNVINGTSGDDFLFGTEGDDLVNLGDGVDVMNGSAGDDVINGGGGAYNQIDYEGKPSDYVFTKNDDGSIRVEKPDGTDTLTDIHGIWFKDDQWYNIDDLIEPNGPNIIEGTSGNDTLRGTDGDDIFMFSGGHDFIYGSAGYDVVELAGSLDDYKFSFGKGGFTLTDNNGNSVSSLKSMGQGNEEFYFIGSDTSYTAQEIYDHYAGNNPNVINGTSGDDFLFGTEGDDLVNLGDGVDVMNGSAGDDVINGGGGAYNQIDYEGKPSDYVFTKNDDGSIRVEKPDGTDTLTDIHGIWFKDDQWYNIDDLFEENFDAVSLASTDY